MTNEHFPSQPKALGLEWNSTLDHMSSCIGKPGSYLQTKRGVASDIAQTFDALGWIAPATLVMKMLQQKLWQLKIGWDDPVPPDLIKLHTKWREQLPLLVDKHIPRCYVRTDVKALKIELHGFSDASAKGQGAVVYLRSTYAEHPPMTSLVSCKTKVTPLKIATTIPRLELNAAELLSTLLSTIQSILEIPDEDIYAWTDSSIVLSWLDGRPKDFKVYVTNRINTFLKHTSPHTWRHVPTKSNPADCASRGMMPADLISHQLWWEGPEFLMQEPITIPPQPPRKPLSTPEQRVVSCNTLQLTPLPLLESQQSNYHKLLVTTAWCLKFINIIKHKRDPDPGPTVNLITASELKQAEHFLVGRSQSRSFPADLLALKHGHALPASSRLKALVPFIDQENLLRVGGRLCHSNLTLSQQHPLITDGKDILIHNLFTHMHVCLGHCGPSLLLTSVGSRFHTLGARRLSRTICSQCKVCRRAAPNPKPQLMGQVPEQRTTPSPAFQTTGLDFAGPFTLKKGHTRKPVHIEAHVCVFVCFSTRAVHLEVISDQTTEAFLAGINRFVSRRGKPHTIFSDNGSNFIGAKKQLSNLYKFLKSSETNTSVHQHLLQHKITWKNSPAKAPPFGRLWEAAVRSMKHHLKRVAGTQILTFEELTTVTCQVEACLNSRPILATTSHNQDGICTLTSGHFLIMQPPTAYPTDPALPDEPRLCKKWQLCQALVQHFWDRWHREYLQTLQSRTKWRHPQPNLQKGDIVILKEKKVFACHWPLARIIETYPGRDGLVRVAMVKTATSTFKRPVTKLALLHREDTRAPPDALPPAACSGKEAFTPTDST